MQHQEFTQEQFDRTDPFEYAYRYNNNKFELEKILHNLAVQAKKFGINNFKGLYKAYVVSQKEEKNAKVGNITEFTNQKLELSTGKWRADDGGISCFDTDGVEYFACEHPVTITERLTNIDTGVEKVKLEYSRAYKWRNIIVAKSMIANSRKIIELSDLGIGVTSENARNLVTYLHDLESENYADIPEKKCCSRLGWIDAEVFAPYCQDLEFDGEVTLKHAFDSVKSKGSLEKWIELAQESRKQSIPTKIILAASFASVLVKPLGALPFFVHMWGDTEVGKTVALMFAASVWANPEQGIYIQSFNSTVVGRERMLSFFNNLPLFLDELQVIKDKKSFDHDIYTMCQGSGKTRGNKNGGTDQTPTWANCIITNGEMPLTNSFSGGGAMNRIIDIECKEALFINMPDLCNEMKKNYGLVGKKFVEWIQQDTNYTKINVIYKKYFIELSKNDTTQKQAISAAIILTADHIISDLFFDGEKLTVKDISIYLQSKKNVSVNNRAYEFLCDWVASNSNRFQKDVQGETFGKIEDNKAFIISSIFNKICSENGFNPTSLLSFLKENNLITCGTKTTKPTRINGILTRCVCLSLLEYSEKVTPY